MDCKLRGANPVISQITLHPGTERTLGAMVEGHIHTDTDTQSDRQTRSSFNADYHHHHHLLLHHQGSTRYMYVHTQKYTAKKYRV